MGSGEWRVIGAVRVQDAPAIYDVELEWLGGGREPTCSCCGAHAEATLSVGNLASRSAGHEPAAWSVFVEICDDERARMWLEDEGNWDAIVAACKRRAA